MTTLKPPPLLIAQFSSGMMHEGEFHYRNYAPGLAMARHPEVYVVSLSPTHPLREDVFREADLVVLHMVYELDLISWIVDRRRDGKPTVYEISDDFDTSSGWPPLDESFAGMRSGMKRLAAGCDAVQFPSAVLGRKYGHLAPLCEVFPNQMIVVPPAKRLQRAPEVVIGWGGSLTHLPDLAETAPLLIKWITSRNDIRLHLMAADPIWNLFDNLPADRKKRAATGSIFDYYRFIDEIDVGIGPLRDIPFNRARTDIKYLEYAARGAVAVMQAAGPYRDAVKHGLSGFLYRDVSQLIEILEALTQDLRLRVRVATAAYDYVVSERHQFRHATKRLEFYRTILGNRGAGQSRGLFEKLTKTQGALAQDRYVLLQPHLAR